MKKKVVAASFLLMTSMLSYAQETKLGDGEALKNKKGREIMPVKGDVALGFNTVPVIDFLLNAASLGGFTGNATNVAGNAVQYTSNTNNQIYGKYFLDVNSAIRVRLGVNSRTGSITNPVQDAKAMHDALVGGTPDDIETASHMTVDDKVKFHRSNVLLAAGYEKRRGYGRLIGFYGAELGIGRSNANQTVTYGNEFSDLYLSDYTSNFNAPATVSTLNPATPTTVSRNLKTTYGGTWRFGLRAFVGVEYFVFPKISVGAEYGWGFVHTRQKGSVETNQLYFNGQSGPVVAEETKETGGASINSGFSVDNNNGGPTYSLNNPLSNSTNGNTALSGGTGAITLLFHF
ncbi:MAG: hypothetical protein Q8M29_05335 [Bacteroidota bacterium]|nr:hypothetical protein [Bacteroidota bacterium]